MEWETENDDATKGRQMDRQTEGLRGWKSERKGPASELSWRTTYHCSTSTVMSDSGQRQCGGGIDGLSGSLGAAG
jgi:hypothetical protein